jgi:hypothetical protein
MCQTKLVDRQEKSYLKNIFRVRELSCKNKLKWHRIENTQVHEMAVKKVIICL